VGNEPDIEAVRIYNKKGNITFSSDVHEVGRSADLSDKACNACHLEGRRVANPNQSELTRIFDSPRGYRVLGMITPIRNQPSCATAECHAHPESQTVLGILDVIVPLEDLDAGLEELRRVQYTSAGAMVIIVTSLAGVFIWLMVNRPVRRLMLGTEEVRKGNLNYRIERPSKDEIGMLADSFNHMTDELKRARNELTEWNRTLEERVHQKTEELRRAQAHMIQIEKMASLGTLAATVAHELNNPLEGVLTYAKLLKRKLQKGDIAPEERAEILDELSIIADETARCGNIVKNLLLFSRQKISALSEVDLQTVIEQSVRLIEHHLRIHNIKLDLRVTDKPVPIMCDISQIEQALLAIEINAVEAMPEGGTLTIESAEFPQTDAVRVSISDTGAGIHDEDLPHIFEPFFTTKHDGKGTGLGLAVVYGIIERHGGSIEVQSQVHKGTTFSITLPRNIPQTGEDK
jgi:two-component system NtrC family sensor kinase